MSLGVHGRLTFVVRWAYILLMGVLEKWMETAAVGDDALGEKLKISRVHASRLRRRKCLPSPDLAKRLEAVTDIPAERFIFEERAA